MRVFDLTAGRFFAVGVANTLVGLSCIYLCIFALGLGNVHANAVGYTIGILTSFALNKRWTFSHTGVVLPAFAKFVVVIVVAYTVNLIVVLLLADGLGWNRYLAQALGIIPYTIVSYLGSRLYAFRATCGQHHEPLRDRLLP